MRIRTISSITIVITTNTVIYENIPVKNIPVLKYTGETLVLGLGLEYMHVKYAPVYFYPQSLIHSNSNNNINKDYAATDEPVELSERAIAANTPNNSIFIFNF